MGALAVDEAAAAQELEDVVARLEALALESLPSTDQIAHLTLGLESRDVPAELTIIVGKAVDSHEWSGTEKRR